MSQPGTKPATQTYALAGDQTSDLSFCGTIMPNQPSHTSQVELAFLATSPGISHTRKSLRALAITDLLRTELPNFSVRNSHLEILLTTRLIPSVGGWRGTEILPDVQTSPAHSPPSQPQDGRVSHPDCSSLSPRLHALAFISSILLLAQAYCTLKQPSVYLPSKNVPLPRSDGQFFTFICSALKNSPFTKIFLGYLELFTEIPGRPKKSG